LRLPIFAPIFFHFFIDIAVFGGSVALEKNITVVCIPYKLVPSAFNHSVKGCEIYVMRSGERFQPCGVPSVVGLIK
jgi:hypothetical protein